MNNISKQVKCIMCSKLGYWDCTMVLTSDPPIEIEHMCPTCIKAIKDAKEQRIYLKKVKR